MCPEVRMVASGLSVYEADALEIERIAFWRERNINLSNKADGGSGVRGVPAWNKQFVTCLTDGLIFNSLEDCAKNYGTTTGCLSSVCQGDRQRATAKGRHFIYGAHALSECERLEKIKSMLALRVESRKRVVSPTAYGSSADGFDVLGRRATGPMKRSKPVVCLDENKDFPSISEAARHYGIDAGALVELCKGQRGRKTLGGHTFKYKDSD